MNISFKNDVLSVYKGVRYCGTEFKIGSHNCIAYVQYGHENEEFPDIQSYVFDGVSPNFCGKLRTYSASSCMWDFDDMKNLIKSNIDEVMSTVPAMDYVFGNKEVVVSFFCKRGYPATVGSMATNGDIIRINPFFVDYIMGLTGNIDEATHEYKSGAYNCVQFQYVFTHELFHCYYNHPEEGYNFYKEGKYANLQKQNFAMDHQINIFLEKMFPKFSGVTKMLGGIIDESGTYFNKKWTKIYEDADYNEEDSDNKQKPADDGDVQKPKKSESNEPSGSEEKMSPDELAGYNDMQNLLRIIWTKAGVDKKHKATYERAKELTMDILSKPPYNIDVTGLLNESVSDIPGNLENDEYNKGALKSLKEALGKIEALLNDQMEYSDSDESGEAQNKESIDDMFPSPDDSEQNSDQDNSENGEGGEGESDDNEESGEQGSGSSSDSNGGEQSGESSQNTESQNEAQSNSESTSSSADSAEEMAQEAINNRDAADAQDAADLAQQAANSAQQSAQSAQKVADESKQTAESTGDQSDIDAANKAQQAANEAKAAADRAQQAAQKAQEAAHQAQEAADKGDYNTEDTMSEQAGEMAQEAANAAREASEKTQEAVANSNSGKARRNNSAGNDKSSIDDRMKNSDKQEYGKPGDFDFPTSDDSNDDLKDVFSGLSNDVNNGSADSDIELIDGESETPSSSKPSHDDAVRLMKDLCELAGINIDSEEGVSEMNKMLETSYPISEYSSDINWGKVISEKLTRRTVTRFRGNDTFTRQHPADSRLMGNRWEKTTYTEDTLDYLTVMIDRSGSIFSDKRFKSYFFSEMKGILRALCNDGNVITLKIVIYDEAIEDEREFPNISRPEDIYKVQSYINSVEAGGGNDFVGNTMVKVAEELVEHKGMGYVVVFTDDDFFWCNGFPYPSYNSDVLDKYIKNIDKRANISLKKNSTIVVFTRLPNIASNRVNKGVLYVSRYRLEDKLKK